MAGDEWLRRQARIVAAEAEAERRRLLEDERRRNAELAEREAAAVEKDEKE